MTSTDSDLIEFVLSYRQPMALPDVANELEQLGKHGAQWPRANSGEWKRRLLEVVARGELRMDLDGMLSGPIAESKPEQMTLF